MSTAHASGPGAPAGGPHVVAIGGGPGRRRLQVDEATVHVLPATVTPVDLVAETPGGAVRGQVDIEGAGEVKRIAVDPAEPPVPMAVLDAIGQEADQVVLGPGSFYTSVLAPAVVPGIRRSLEARRGRFVFVCNLRAAETNVHGWDVARHVTALHDHGLRPDVVVTQRGGLPVGRIDGVQVVEADIDRPHGLAHDADLLGAVLASLV